MKKGMRRRFKWLVILLVAAGVIEAVHFHAIFHPELFFEHTEEFGPFRVFSSLPVSPGFEEVLEEVIERLESSEVYSRDHPIKIILATEGLYFTLAGGSPIPRTTGDCIILGGRVDMERNRLVLPAVELNLVYVLAHEAVHVGQHEEHGLFMNTFLDLGRHPSWKTEGYAEWISQKGRLGDGLESISSGLRILERSDGRSWVDLGDGYTMPASYLRDRIMVEYLQKVDGMVYAEMMKANIPESHLWDKIIGFEQGSDGSG